MRNSNVPCIQICLIHPYHTTRKKMFTLRLHNILILCLTALKMVLKSGMDETSADSVFLSGSHTLTAICRLQILNGFRNTTAEYIPVFDAFGCVCELSRYHGPNVRLIFGHHLLFDGLVVIPQCVTKYFKCGIIYFSSGEILYIFRVEV